MISRVTPNSPLRRRRLSTIVVLDMNHEIMQEIATLERFPIIDANLRWSSPRRNRFSVHVGDDQGREDFLHLIPGVSIEDRRLFLKANLYQGREVIGRQTPSAG